MQPATHPPSTSPSLTRHLQRRLLRALLITSLGLGLVVVSLILAFSRLGQSTSGRVVEASQALYYEYLTLMVIAFWVWSIASIWLVYRLLAPILRDLDALERTSIDLVYGGAVRPPTDVLSPVRSPANPIFDAYRFLLDHFANRDAPQMYFLELASHELRSPLASIVGYSAMLGDPTAQLSAPEVERFAGIIVKQAQRMTQLIERMLTIAKLEGDRLELNRTPLRLRRLISELVEEARQQNKHEIVFDDGLVLSVCWGDQLRLREVFSNLIENAVKYSSPDTIVRVSLRPAEKNQYVDITIEDQGIGIAEEALPILFTRFGRVRTPQTQGIPGHGLGLYIVKRIVEGHGGSITVRSQPGTGTAFIVRLPLGAD
jgi:signal transduction histidine kinase